MQILKDVVLIRHFLGPAAIIGGVLAQMRQTPKRVDALVVHGALTQMVTGVALVGLDQALDDPVDNTKVGIKLVILLVITVLAWRHRKAEAVATWVWATIGLLTVVNIAIAVIWQSGPS